MKRLIEFDLESGNTVVVEVDESVADSLVPAGGATDTVAKARVAFQEGLEKLRPAIEVVVTKLRELPKPADEVSLEFGIGFSAKVGAFLTSATTQASVKVSLTWKLESGSV